MSEAVTGVSTSDPAGWDKAEPGPEQTLNPMELVTQQIAGLRKEVEDAKAETTSAKHLYSLAITDFRATKEKLDKAVKASDLLYGYIKQYPYISRVRDEKRHEALSAFEALTGTEPSAV